MRSHYLSSGLLILCMTLQVTSRPLSAGVREKRGRGHAGHGGNGGHRGHGGWPRVDGGGHECCEEAEIVTTTVTVTQYVGGKAQTHETPETPEAPQIPVAPAAPAAATPTPDTPDTPDTPAPGNADGPKPQIPARKGERLADGASGQAKALAAVPKPPSGPAPKEVPKSPSGQAKALAAVPKPPSGAAPKEVPKSPSGQAKAPAAVPKSPSGQAKAPAAVPKSPTGQAAIPKVAPAPGGKKGLTYNNPSLISKFPGVSWVTNWDQQLQDIPQGVRYYPMLWNAAKDRTDRWQVNAEAAIARGHNVLLGFNEPENEMCQHGQACMGVDEAVAAWKQFMLPYKAKGATLVAPSIAQTPGSQEWLTQFMAKCPPAECGIGAIALHWYQEVTMMDYFKDYITKAHNNPAFGKLPVYVTEWAPQSVVDRNPTKDGEAKLAAFIKEACEWMDQQDWILGYALFNADNFNAMGNIDGIGAAYGAA